MCACPNYKEKIGLYLHTCLYVCICVCPGMYEFFRQVSQPTCILAGHLVSIYRAAMYLSANPSISLFELKLCYLYFRVKQKWIKIKYFKFITGQIKIKCVDVGENATRDLS